MLLTQKQSVGLPIHNLTAKISMMMCLVKWVSIAVLLVKELSSLNYYGFTSESTRKPLTRTELIFFGEEILEKTYQLFGFYDFYSPKYSGLSEVEKILKSTNQKLIYQEQLMDILQTVGKCSLTKADSFRIEMMRRKSENLKPLCETLAKDYGEEGKRLFEYLYKNAMHIVSKAFAIASLQTGLKFNQDEN